MCQVRTGIAFLFTFFVVNVVSSCGIIGYAIWHRVKISQTDVLSAFSWLQVSSYILISSACLHFFSGFLILYGGMKGNARFLKMYYPFGLISLSLSVTATILAFYYHDRVDALILPSVIKQFQQDYENPFSVTNSFDYFQTTFSCCGVRSIRDYGWLEIWRKSNTRISSPFACCTERDLSFPCNAGVPGKPDATSKVNIKGCVTPMADFFIAQFKLIGIVANGYAFVPLIGMTLSAIVWMVLETGESKAVPKNQNRSRSNVWGKSFIN